MKFALVLTLLCASPALAAVEQPDFSPKPGQQITLGTMLTDETGQQKTLGDFLHKRPAVVVFGYQNEGCHRVLRQQGMPSGAACVERSRPASIKSQHNLHMPATRRIDRG
ncbi:MAG: hypothetical protein J0J15_25590 [Mesorhizobium sp.]|nr:hypothetical protein [Mesorhizobium sp.]